jgi:hypothetical protein
MNKLSSQRSHSRLLLNENGSALGVPGSVSPSPAAACSGFSRPAPSTPFVSDSASASASGVSGTSLIVGDAVSARRSACSRSWSDSVEIRIVGIPATSSESCFAAPAPWRTSFTEGDATPRTEASSSAPLCASVVPPVEPVSPPVPTEAFCIRYSSSITKTRLLVFRSSSHPIWETSRVSRVYARAQVPRRPGAGRRRRAGSACAP